MQSSRIAWDLKPLIAETAARTGTLSVETVAAFSYLPDLASMRHPALETRLFVS
jgi:urease accessory protein UreF